MLVRERRFDLANVSAGRLVTEVAILCESAPDLIAEARRGLTEEQGMAA
ncbi:MAG: hypothetical protein M3536_09085 [Actinomycetota bacterium]|nr:hypothetical protein [Actinomycetota bacterium]